MWSQFGCFMEGSRMYALSVSFNLVILICFAHIPKINSMWPVKPCGDIDLGEHCLSWWGNPLVTSGFPSQKANNEEDIFMPWIIMCKYAVAVRCPKPAHFQPLVICWAHFPNQWLPITNRAEGFTAVRQRILVASVDNVSLEVTNLALLG